MVRLFLGQQPRQQLTHLLRTQNEHSVVIANGNVSRINNNPTDINLPIEFATFPRLRVVTALIPRLNTGRRCSRKAATSVTAPDMTTPARPLMSAARVRSSPQQAQ